MFSGDKPLLALLYMARRDLLRKSRRLHEKKRQRTKRVLHTRCLKERPAHGVLSDRFLQSPGTMGNRSKSPMEEETAETRNAIARRFQALPLYIRQKAVGCVFDGV